MEFTKQDLNHCSNLIKALRKGTFNLEGLEVIALAQAMNWLGKLEAVITASTEQPPPASPPLAVTPVQSPVTPNAPKVSRTKKGV